MVLVRRTLVLAGLVCAALGPAGCFVDIDFGSSAFLCMNDPMVCPAGFECRGGRCLESGALIDAGALDGPDAAGAPIVGAFTPGAPIPGLEMPGVGADDASFTADRLTAIFNRTGDLFTSSRSSVEAPWPTPTRDAALSTAAAETTVALSSDGLTILFASDRDAPAEPTNLDLYISTRVSRAAAWSVPTQIISLSSASDDAASWISDGGTTVLFHSERGGDFDIYQAERNAQTGEYENIALVPGVNTPSDEDSARFARGELVITFHSDRPGAVGSFDLFVATRASTEQPFGTPRLIEGVNTLGLDEDAWLSDDLCHLAFATPDSVGNQQLVESTCVE